MSLKCEVVAFEYFQRPQIENRILRTYKIIKYILFVFLSHIPLTIITVIKHFFSNYFIAFHVFHRQQKKNNKEISFTI